LVGPQLTQDMLSKLVGMFEESNLPYQVDLSILKDIDNPSLQEHIERVGKVLYERRGDLRGSFSCRFSLRFFNLAQ
jgi:hypothetical protein